MEVMPYRPDLDTHHDLDTGHQPGMGDEPGTGAPPTLEPRPTPGRTPADWHAGLPTLQGTRVTLRDLRLDDAASLCALLTTDEVTRFISPPPASVDGFKAFIAWAHRRRGQGRYACFAVVPHGTDTAVGLFQIHLDDADAGTAEWGFVLGAPYWGTGLFVDGARLVVAFAFEALGLQRLDARSTLQNGRGNGALRKIGAVRDRILRRSFERAGEYFDQRLWTILREDWSWATMASGHTIH